MKTMEHRESGYVFRWNGRASFIPVWQEHDADATVPYDMHQVPAWVTKTNATREVLVAAAREWLRVRGRILEARRPETALDAIREIRDILASPDVAADVKLTEIRGLVGDVLAGS